MFRVFVLRDLTLNSVCLWIENGLALSAFAAFSMTSHAPKCRDRRCGKRLLRRWVVLVEIWAGERRPSGPPLTIETPTIEVQDAQVEELKAASYEGLNSKPDHIRTKKREILISDLHITTNSCTLRSNFETRDYHGMLDPSKFFSTPCRLGIATKD
jgi:hypothetical protein